MTDAAEHALVNIIHEYGASSQSLNLRERIDVLKEMACFAMMELDLEEKTLDDIEWAGTSPMGGQ